MKDRVRTTPSGDGCPASRSARILGQWPLIVRHATPRMPNRSPAGRICQSQYRRGPAGRSKLANSRPTRYRNRRVPGRGGVWSFGGRSPRSNRSREAKIIPPHRPFAAFPTGTEALQTPSRKSGPGAKSLAKWKPFALGKKSSTRLEITSRTSLGPLIFLGGPGDN